MGDVISVRVRVDWMDSILQRIHEDRKCQLLRQKVNTFRMQMKEEEACFYQLENLLKQAEESFGEKEPKSCFDKELQIQDLVKLLHLEVVVHLLCLSL